MRITRNSLAAVSFVVAFGASSLGHAHHRAPAPAPVEHVAVADATVCNNFLTVRFGLQKLNGHTWTFLQDDGKAKLEQSSDSGRSWKTLPTTSGGEGALRTPSAPVIPASILVRVSHNGWVSTSRLEENC